MRRIFVIVGFVLFFAFPAKATITEIQHPQTTSSTCSKTVNTCTLTVSPTGSGHFGIVMITLLSASNTWVTSVTDNQGGVWTVPGNTGSGGCYLFTGAYGTTGCAFNLTLPAGVTSITGTWSSAVPEGAEMDFREYAYTGSSVALDSIGSYGHAPQVSSPITGIVPTLSGANDVIVQSFATGSDRATGVSVYGNANIGDAYFGSADSLNTVSTTPPTFTLCCTTAAYAFIYVAIKEIDNFDIYVAQNAAGNNTGADCADAFAYSTVSFNTFGTTYHLCGAFSMPAGSSGPITITGSGTSTSPINIKFESGASASAPYWGPNGFIYASNVSYITVDGGTNGSIKATANGTTLANQVTPTSAITFVNVSSAEIKNLSISDIYVHAASPNDEVGTQDTWGIQWTNGSNVTIDNNTIHDAYGCIYYQSAPNATSSSVKIFNNTAYNCNWSITTTAGGTGAILNSDLIYGNVLHDWANWDETADQNAHSGISVFATGSGAQVNGLQVYKNLVYGNMTTITSYLYLSQPPGTISNPYVFNNIFYNVSTGYPANGYIYDYSTGANVFNNTIVGGSASSSGGSGYVLNASGSTLYNNIFSTCNIGIQLNPGASFSASDYNDISNCSDAGESLGTVESTLASWQAGTGLDAHSSNGDPLLNSASTPPYQLSNLSSAAYRTGTNLTAYCASVPAICSDYAGNARPATGSWDIGALAYGGTAQQAATPACTPGSGAYTAVQAVTCTNPSSAPVLCYTTNGTTPATNGLTGCTIGAVASGAISVTPSQTGTVLKVVTGGAGFLDSLVASNTYTYTVASTPVCSPGTGTYNNTPSVTCTNPSSAPVLCYTTNGTVPATNGTTGCAVGTPLGSAISITATGTNLQVVAGGAGFTDSTASSSTYALAVGAPTLSPGGGSYLSSQNVAISTATSGAALLYCFDGSNSCTPGTPYTGLVAVSSSGYLRTQATLFGFVSSGISSALYTFPGSAIITEIQHPQTKSSTCSKTVNTCTLTVAPTGSGHFGVVMITLLSSTNAWVTSVTDNMGGVWAVPGNTGSGGCHLYSGAYGATGCAYNLSLPAGVTSITATWSSVLPKGAEMDFREYSSTGTSVSLDSIGTYNHPQHGANAIQGISPLLSGINDVIVQSFTSGSDHATGVTTYGNADIGNSYFGSADLLNTTSTTAPTFSICCSTVAYAVIYVAIKVM